VATTLCFPLLHLLVVVEAVVQVAIVRQVAEVQAEVQRARLTFQVALVLQGKEIMAVLRQVLPTTWVVVAVVALAVLEAMVFGKMVI
jgi:hypothetical protein